MVTIAQVSQSLQQVFKKQANELAQITGFMERERILTGSSFMLGLISGWVANPQASLACLSQAIGNAGTPLTRQALDRRFDEEAVAFSRAMLEEVLTVAIQVNPVPHGILSRFTSVEVTDSSIITLPNELAEMWQGCGGFGENASVASVKLNVRFDVMSGQLKVLDLSDGTQHDTRSIAHHADVPVGGVLLEDLGYFGLDDLEKLSQQGSFWLTRYKVGTIITNIRGKRVNLLKWLPTQENACHQVDVYVKVGAKKKLPARLIAQRAPKDAVEQRRKRLTETARQDQRPVSQQAWDMAQWTIYLTNIPPEKLAPPEVFILGRYRWQIELLFKLWKSELQIDEWQTRKPHRILCELYIKLIGVVVTQWLLQLATWHQPRRSWVQAMGAIRGLVWQIANSLASLRLLRHALKALQRSLTFCRMDKSQQHPRTFQLIYDNIS